MVCYFLIINKIHVFLINNKKKKKKNLPTATT